MIESRAGTVARLLAQVRDDETLDTTALVHEAHPSPVDQSSPDWKDRAHFLAAASLARRGGAAAGAWLYPDLEPTSGQWTVRFSSRLHARCRRIRSLGS